VTKLEEHQSQANKDFLEYFNIPFPYEAPKPEWGDTDSDKILVLSDLHEPYGNESVYSEALNHKDAGTLVIPGDIGDYYSKSRFRKTKHVIFKDEVRAVFYRLEWMSRHWRSIKIMIGNHDNRPEKTIAGLFDGNADLLILTEQNLLKRLASYFENIEVVGTQIEGTGIGLTHIYQHGDIIFTHGEMSHTRKEMTLAKVSEYLYKWKRVLGLKPYTVIAQAHNHQELKTSEGTERWFMLPTASDPYSLGFEYIFSSRMYGRPPKVGYSVFYQKDGVTDYNKSHNIIIPYEINS